MDFFEVVHRRQSVRAFRAQPVEPGTLKRLLEAMAQAPSAGNLQAYEVVLVREPAAKLALARAAHDQDFLAGAPVVLVFCANPRRSEPRYGARGGTLYCVQDASIAAAYVQLASVAEGLATVWVGAFDEAAVGGLVGGLKPVCILPVGYPAETPERTPRRTVEDLVHEGRLPS